MFKNFLKIQNHELITNYNRIRHFIARTKRGYMVTFEYSKRKCFYFIQNSCLVCYRHIHLFDVIMFYVLRNAVLYDRANMP